MNFEIKKEDWADFFETLSQRRYEWRIRIEVLRPDIGVQTLTDGLPLNGITVETSEDSTSIDLSIGESTSVHQTHNIKNPVRVAFLPAEGDRGDIIDIEEADGTKTLISFIEAMGIMVGYTEIDVVAKAA